MIMRSLTRSPSLSLNGPNTTRLLLLQSLVVVLISTVLPSYALEEYTSSGHLYLNVSCTVGVINVTKLEYYSTSGSRCHTTCPSHISAAYRNDFLFGRNTMCSNEFNVRKTCTGQQSCVLDSRLLKQVYCGSESSSQIKLFYKCLQVGRDYLDICHDYHVRVPSGHGLIIASPFDDVKEKSYCYCNIQRLDGRLDINVYGVRMLTLGSNILWIGNKRIATSSNDEFPLKTVSSFLDTDSIRLAPTTASYVAGDARVFLQIEYKGSYIIKCNGGSSLVTLPPTETVFHSTTSTPSVVTLGSSSGDDVMPRSVLVAIIVALVALLFLAVVIILIFVFKRRKRNMGYHSPAGFNVQVQAPSVSSKNTDGEFDKDDSTFRSSTADNTIAEQNGNSVYYYKVEPGSEYGVIDDDEAQPYRVAGVSHPNSPTTDVDPLLNGPGTSGNQQAVRNSRGSLLNQTEYDVISSGYASPMSDGRGLPPSPKHRIYDHPPDNVYTAIKKPEKDDVELLDNDLYES